ncbi:MAG: hypothetical protein VX465_07210, partial [Pseudomonadota bacterium]|nr:hypothetical protein [Pseudomonadota bacterium]
NAPPSVQTTARNLRHYGFEIAVDDTVLGEIGTHFEDVAIRSGFPLGRPQDMSLQLKQAGSSSYLSEETLPAGRWIARVSIAVGDQRWTDEAEVQ